MSRQKKVHIDKRKTQGSAPRKAPRSAQVVRIHLIDWRSVILTFVLLLVLVAALFAMTLAGWFDNPFGSVLSVLMGFFICALIYDIALLLTACMTVDTVEGLVLAGKNASGDRMVFHTASVERIELRDRSGAVLPDDLPRYRKLELTFVMNSGRVNARPLNVLTQKQWTRIKQLVLRDGQGN